MNAHSPIRALSFEDRLAEIAARAEYRETLTAIHAIAERVSAATGLPVSDILGRRRTAPLVEARHLVLYEAHDTLGLPYHRIGKALGYDHSTVANAVFREGMRRGVTA